MLFISLCGLEILIRIDRVVADMCAFILGSNLCAIAIGDEDGWLLILEVLGSIEKGKKNGRSMQST